MDDIEFGHTESHPCNRAYQMPTEGPDLEKFASNLCEPFRFILLMGLSCTGKSSFMDAYDGRDGWTMTQWNRDNIWDMWFTDGTRVDKMYNDIDNFEDQFLPRLFDRQQHQVIVEGWNRMPNKRSRYLNLFPEAMGRTACIVFDGPTDLILERNLDAQKLNMPDYEIEERIPDLHQNTVWPTFDEGWNRIYYVTTFGRKGVKYLKERVDVQNNE